MAKQKDLAVGFHVDKGTLIVKHESGAEDRIKDGVTLGMKVRMPTGGGISYLMMVKTSWFRIAEIEITKATYEKMMKDADAEISREINSHRLLDKANALAIDARRPYSMKGSRMFDKNGLYVATFLNDQHGQTITEALNRYPDLTLE